MFLVGPDGVVQNCESGVNPKLAEELPAQIEKLLAGESIYQKPLQEYQEELKQYAKMVESSSADEAVSGSMKVEDRKLPEVKTAPRSEPATLKLQTLWKCPDIRSPGNVLVLDGKEGPRLAVIENWKSIAEVGADGKRIALHTLNITDGEAIGSLRSAVGADGKRYIVAFLPTQQRCHVLDDKWNVVAHYPEDAMQKPHSGISDVEIGDLNGDGKLEMYVSYWGVVGVQGVSLDGKRLWGNRSLANVIGLAIGGPDEKNRRKLYCTNNTESIIALDSEGQRQGETTVRNHLLHWIVAADLRGDGKRTWCGLASPMLGENTVVGFSLETGASWTYKLPAGLQPQPIEPIIAGRIVRQGAGQWILPGPDGSVHILSADGKLLDKFNSGVMLQGLATLAINGQPALVIATANGLEAWKVE
jgi:hypothetical protein